MHTSFEARFAGSIPDLRALGPTLLVPFEAYRLPDARIAWINQRWFLEQGVFAAEPRTRATIESWLLNEYAYACADEGAGNDSKTFYADRYGGEGVANNGGSGRCGIGGLFGIKGIGLTPLSRLRNDPFHSNGVMTLDEALREAILSEIFRHELPFGAVPVVAVILTGRKLTYVDHGETIHQPCALVIRPNFVRPAHLLRAIYFGDAPAEWLADVQRVREAAAAVGCTERRARLHLGEHGYELFVQRLACQIAYGLVHRLAHGPYSLSNMSIQGEMADFGAASSLPTWGAAASARGYPAFGPRQFARFLAQAHELHRKLRSAGSSFVTDSSFEEISSRAVQTYEAACNTEVVRSLGTGADADPRTVADAMAAIRLQQQHPYETAVATRDTVNAWFFDARRDMPEHGPRGQVSAAFEPLAQSVLACAEAHTARRYLSPRPQLYKAEQIRRLQAEYRQIADQPARIAQLIDAQIDQSIRRWPGAADTLIVKGHVFAATCSAQWCGDAQGRRSVLIVEGPCAEGRAQFFGSTIDAARLARDGGRARFIARLPHTYRGESTSASYPGGSLAVPAMTVLYRAA